MSALRECHDPGYFCFMMGETVSVYPAEGLDDNGDALESEPFEVVVYAEGSLIAAVNGTQNNTFLVSFTEIRMDDKIKHKDCGDCYAVPSSINRYDNPCQGTAHWEVIL